MCSHGSSGRSSRITRVSPRTLLLLFGTATSRLGKATLTQQGEAAEGAGPAPTLGQMRRHTDDPDGGSGRALWWEPVPDEDATADAAPDPRRRGKVRALVAGCVLGALAIVGITVVGVRAAVDDVHERTGPQSIHDRYDARYRACVRDGTSPGACAERIFDRCAADGDWGDSPDEAAILDNCRFGPAAQASTSASSTAS